MTAQHKDSHEEICMKIFGEIIPKDIELHPDLVGHVEDDGVIPALRHPLYVVAPYLDSYIERYQANKSYEAAKLHAKRRYNDGDIEGYIFAHARPFRLDTLIKVMDEIDDEQYWKCVRRVWVDSESPYVNQRIWQWLLFHFRNESRHLLFSADAIAKLRELPETVTIYRGGHKNGLSWTLLEEKAVWFAHRWNKHEPVYRASIRKEDIAGLFLSRGEEEVIPRPGSLIDVTKIY